MSWTCADCQVRVHWLPGFDPPPVPCGWAKVAGQLICLACRRSRVVASVTDADGQVDRRARREALVAFEHRRRPEATSSEIGKLIGEAPVRVGRVRSQLLTEGVIDPPPSQKRERRTAAATELSRRQVLRQTVESELTAHPDHADGWIAHRIGTTNATVRRARLRLEETGTIPALTLLVRSDGRNVKWSAA